MRYFYLVLTTISGFLILFLSPICYLHLYDHDELDFLSLTGLILPAICFSIFLFLYRRKARSEVELDMVKVAQAKVELQEHVKFEYTVDKGNSTTLFLAIIIAIPYLLLVFTGKFSSINPTAEELFKWGGENGFALAEGQYWRLLTSMFLHASPIHILFNSLGLYYIGRYVNHIFGLRLMSFIFILSGILGSLLSASLNPQVVSVGASSGVFGLGGAILVVLFFSKKNIVQIPRSLIVIVALNILNALIKGLKEVDVDNIGHIGGLIGGFIIALPLFYLQENKKMQMRALYLELIIIPVLSVLLIILFIPKPTRVVASIISENSRFTEMVKSNYSFETENSSHLESLIAANDSQISNWIVSDYLPKLKKVLELTENSVFQEKDQIKIRQTILDWRKKCYSELENISILSEINQIKTAYSKCKEDKRKKSL